MNAKREISNQAAAAKAIRKYLKDRGLKARVRSDSFSGGDSVDAVIYEDIAPEVRKEIVAEVGKYQYGHFDGSIDLYEYSNKRSDIPQAKYVNVRVEYSARLKADAALYVSRIGGIREFDRDLYAYRAITGAYGNFWKVREDAAKALARAERSDYEIVLARTKAKARGATPVEVERNVLELSAPPITKELLIRNGRGEVTGSVPGYYSEQFGGYVTIPERDEDVADRERADAVARRLAKGLRSAVERGS